MDRFAFKVKQVEQWLIDRPWFIWGLRVVILWPMFLFWVFPTWGPLRDGIRENARKQAEYLRRDIHAEAQKSKQFAQKANELLAKAKKSGLDYGPRQYFNDVRSLESWALKNHLSLTLADGQLTEMQQIMRDNCKPDALPALDWSRKEREKWFRNPRKFVQSQIISERERYSHLRNISEEDVAAQKKHFREVPLKVKMAWLWGIWLRGMLPMFFFYLLRMVERKGILETFLANKIDFVAAITNWPAYTFAYPANVIREIQVEAELRRIDKLFRSLNPVEYTTVLRIASTENFHERLKALREAHRPEYQRGLLVALAATLLCLIVLPKASEAKTAKTKANPQGVVMAMARAGPMAEVMLATDSGPPPALQSEAAFPDGPKVLVLGSEPLDPRDERPPLQEVARRIDHIPDVDLSVPVVSSTGARARRQKDENRLCGFGRDAVRWTVARSFVRIGPGT